MLIPASAETRTLAQGKFRIIFPSRSAAAHAVLSMVYTQQGKIEAAKMELARTREAVSPNWPEGETLGVWDDWLVAYLLLQEAEKLISNPQQPEGTK